MNKEETQNEHKGLSSKEARKRLLKFGENTVFKRRGISPIVAFVKKFNSPLVIILALASLVSFFFGQKINAIIILMMIIISAILEFINSYKSEKATEKLSSKITTTATVLRDGEKQEIDLKKIVPDDIIFLSAGDIIPADCEVLEAKDFFVNESVLTGESFPTEKHIKGKVFLGTSVVTGFATTLALKTGHSTEFGKIAEKLSEIPPETDFEKSIKKFSIFIAKVIIVMVVFVFLANAILKRNLLESFIFAIAIAVGVTPELLPVIMSVSLSRGSIRMAKKDIIVKNLSSINNFGEMNILCTDKTGTLTEDKITLIKHIDGFGKESEEVLLYSYLSSILHTGVEGPLDKAIKEYKKIDVSHYKKIDEIPFDFSRKRNSIIIEKDGKRIISTMGAPYEIFHICKSYKKDGKDFKFDSDVKNNIESLFNDLSNDGFRVLAIAVKEIHSHHDTYEVDEEKDMAFLGFTAFLDPPKKGVKETMDEFENLGIEVKILTGDNEILSKKICKDIDLPYTGILLNSEIENMSDAELTRKAKQTTIFARITPQQKERIIKVLREAKNVVGYLGDGINDAPSLRAADVGISVNNAVDVAKETADIILTHKSLSVLKDGIIEGRKTFHNTMKYLMMVLSSNFGNMFSMVVASIFLPFLPMLPAQILLNNLLYDSSQLSISTDTVDEEEIKKPPKWNISFIKKFMLTFGAVSSIFDFLTFGILLLIFKLTEHQFQAGWFIESIATQVFVIYIIRTKKIPFIKSWPGKIVLINTLLIVAIAWILPFSPLGKIFNFETFSFNIVLYISGIVLIYLVITEIVKRIFYKRISLPLL
ncbi:MAG: magnesium-translocating P-type ATPase [Patescibacteria group bacterium]